MKCPIDATPLVMSDRHGVEIDYCPTCRGVWLDRGELDKIIEKAAPPVAPVALQEPGRAVRDEPRREDPRREDPRRDDYRGDDRRRDDDDDYRKRGKRRESFLGDLFDF